MKRIGSWMGRVLLLGVALAGSQAMGSTIEWLQNTTGYWTNAVNWSGGVVPTPANCTQLRIARGGTCIVDAPVDVPPLYVGISSAQPGATLRLVDGGSMFIATSVFIGYNNSGAGTGIVEQTGGQWDNNGINLPVGTAFGYGAYYMTGGSLTNVNTLSIAQTDYRDRGWMTISGSAHVKVTGQIYVGQNGTGVLTLGPGGKLVSGTLETVLSRGSASTGRVDQVGGVWDNNNQNLRMGWTSGASWYRISGGVFTNCATFAVANGTGASTLEVVGSEGRFYTTTFTMGANARMIVAPDANGLTPIRASGNVTLNGPLTVDFENSEYHSSLVLIEYGGTRSGTFSSKDVITPDWSADIAYDDVNKQVKLVNIIGPPLGTILIVR